MAREDDKRRMVTDSTDDDGDTGRADGTSLERGSDELLSRELAGAGLDGPERRAAKVDMGQDAWQGAPEKGEMGDDERAYRDEVAATEPDMVAADAAEQGSREDPSLVDARMRGEAELREILERIDAKEREAEAERRRAEQEQWYPGRRSRFY